MAYVPGFEHDVVISYAHVDNEPFGESQKRWVSDFHRDLQTRVTQLLGNAATIWRDPRLEGNQVLWEALRRCLEQSAVLVSVLSPRYIDSKSCIYEIEFFPRAAENTGGFQIGTRKRVFKVLKTPVPLDQHPAALRDLLGYEFYRVDPGTGRPREFHIDPNPDAPKLYWAKVDDLAQDIRALLAEMRRQRTGSREPQAAKPEVSIYVAETTHDLTVERDQLLRELKDRRYRVLPEKPLPSYAGDLNQAVRADLEKCRLSLHPIGANYGVVPEGATCSAVALQHELAAERAKRNGFSQVIWMRPGLQPAEDRQKEFISQLENYASARNGFELFKAGLEDLKTYIQDKLRTRAKPQASQTPDESPAHFYLVCGAQDSDAARRLKNHFFQRGFEVTLLAWKGDLAQLREAHEENLRLCDATLIYYGSADELWFGARLRDLQKATGMGRTKGPLIAGIYLGAPNTTEKVDFQSRQYQVISGLEGFSPESLDPFVKQIERQKGGSA